MINYRILINKIINFFKFRYNILSCKNETKIQLLNSKEIGIIKHPIIGTRNIRYSILFDGEKYCRAIQHNDIKVLK
jgi:hypothetical protein